ncbi:MAG TPA: DUF5131 family protein [Solirubrobacteraceae bacterium]|nr:DUF5131 family protein [Solirubrobacteraceae bacterium]
MDGGDLEPGDRVLAGQPGLRALLREGLRGALARFIDEIFATMRAAHWHTFQILTKRHERMAELADRFDWPPNVWMGVTIENRRFVHRADALRRVPAAVRFISAEPLLGPLDGLDLDGIDWLIAGGESGPATAGSTRIGSVPYGTHAAPKTSRSSSSSGAATARSPTAASSTAVAGTITPGSASRDH